VQAAPPLAAEAAGAAQQTEPAPAGGGKKDKERQRKERQRQRKVDVARQALQWAMEAMAQHGVRCVHSHVSPPSKSRLAHRSGALTVSLGRVCRGVGGDGAARARYEL
jgi:hypothetical protein